MDMYGHGYCSISSLWQKQFSCCLVVNDDENHMVVTKALLPLHTEQKFFIFVVHRLSNGKRFYGFLWSMAHHLLLKCWILKFSGLRSSEVFLGATLSNQKCHFVVCQPFPQLSSEEPSFLQAGFSKENMVCWLSSLLKLINQWWKGRCSLRCCVVIIFWLVE